MLADLPGGRGAVGLALSRLTPKLEDAIKSAGAKLEAADAAAATKQQNARPPSAR